MPVTAIGVLPAYQPTTPQETLRDQALNAIQASDADFFESLAPAALKELLDEIVLDLGPEKMDQLAELLSLETLEAAVREQYPEHVNALETAKAMLQEAKYYLAATECKASPSLKARLTSILDIFLSILESFIHAFGIAEFFKPPENGIDSDFKSQKIMLLLSIFTMLSGILIPLLGPSLGATIIGSSLLAIAALSLIYPLIKPQATALPRGENWTAQLQQGDLFAADGRQETLDKMARTLIAGNQHLMLLGKTGIGKTATAKAFVQAVERGDYPELQGKQIFYFNTENLLAGTEYFTSANKIFAQISEAMGRHRENFILVFDEIHMACQEQEQGALSEQLKTFLDPGKNNFPYVIGITTEEEFYREIYQHNPAFARRFQQMVIENTDDEETIKILHNDLLKQAPEVLLEDNALQLLLEKTQQAFDLVEEEGPPKKAAQPGTSLKILSQCITRANISQTSPLEAEVDQARGALQALYAQGAGKLPYGRGNEAKNLERELQELEEQLKTVKKEIEELFESRDSLLQLKKATLKKVVDAGKLNANSLSEKEMRQLNLFSLESHFQARLLEAKIRQEADRLDIKTVIDTNIIDQVIAEELENNQRVQEVIDQGRKQINERVEGG